MILSRTVTENALINKHLIKAMPIVDSNNVRFIEEASGNELRTLNRYAVTYDFIANIIDRAKKTGNIGRFIKDTGNYYATWVSEDTFRRYFDNCGNHTIRQSLMRQVATDIQNGWVFARGVNSKGEKFIRSIPPFRFMERRVYEDGRVVKELLFSKVVFESLVEDDCTKKGSDGYIEIPSNFYPLLTGTDKGELTSFNPIYKLNVFGLYKNTHKGGEIVVPRHDLIQTIAPEYLDENGYLKKITEGRLHDSLIKSVQDAVTNIPDVLLVKNFYLGNKGGLSRLYFRKPQPLPFDDIEF